MTAEERKECLLRLGYELVNGTAWMRITPDDEIHIISAEAVFLASQKDFQNITLAGALSRSNRKT